VHVLKEHVAHEPHTRWECRSVPYYQNTALYPLTDLFQRILRFEAHETSDAKLSKLEHALSQYRLPLEESVPLFAPLLSLPISENRYPPLNLSPQRQRQKTLETIVALFLELAERQPALFIVEDLHWTDPTTLELLNLVLDQTPTAAMLVLLTCRPTFQPSWHHRSYMTEMTLHRLSYAQVEQIVTGMTDGNAFPAEVLAQIIEKTDGVPLFVEEITKAILESGQLTAVDGHYELAGALSTLAIPATLQDSLMARLDRLVTAKAVAQYAAVIGRQFSYALLQAVSQLDAAMLQHELGRLVEAEIVFQRGVPPQATYLFKHALIQDAAYQSLLRSTRQQYHQRIALVLEAQFPKTAEAQPELLAHHYTESGLAMQAVEYWQRAGARSHLRSAYVEAVAHCSKGLEVLKSLPDTAERTQHELLLQTTLGPALIISKSFAAPEVEQAYTRARVLCQRLGDTPQLFPVVRGLASFYLSRAELRTARELGEQLLHLAQGSATPGLFLEAHRVLGEALFFLGELAPARQSLEHGVSLYDPQQHRSHAFLYGEDPGVACLSYAALTLWSQGYPDQALTSVQETLTLAQEHPHRFSLGRALVSAAWLHQLRREGQLGQAWAEAAMTLSTEQGFPHWLVVGTVLRGWALAAQGQGAEGIAQMHQAAAARRGAGAKLVLPYWLAMLAEAYGGMRQAAEGLVLVAEALAVVNTTGERHWEAELYRLKGELLLHAADHEAEAEACFQQALAIARRQQAKSWELRTAMSLAGLWQRQGKRTEARELLAPIYGWFTEGFDTVDLQEAKALLEDLT
jgi:predicted ATPase